LAPNYLNINGANFWIRCTVKRTTQVGVTCLDWIKFSYRGEKGLIHLKDIVNKMQIKSEMGGGGGDGFKKKTYFI